VYAPQLPFGVQMDADTVPKSVPDLHTYSSLLAPVSKLLNSFRNAGGSFICADTTRATAELDSAIVAAAKSKAPTAEFVVEFFASILFVCSFSFLSVFENCECGGVVDDTVECS